MPTIYASPSNGPDSVECACCGKPRIIEVWVPPADPDTRHLIIESDDNETIAEIPLTPAVRAALIKALV